MPAASLFANAAGGYLLGFSSQLSLVAAQPPARATWAQAGSFPTSETAPLQQLLSQRRGWIPKTGLLPHNLCSPQDPVWCGGHSGEPTCKRRGSSGSTNPLQVSFFLQSRALSKMEAPGLCDLPRTVLYQGTARDSDPTHTPLLGLSLYQMISLNVPEGRRSPSKGSLMDLL